MCNRAPGNGPDILRALDRLRTATPAHRPNLPRALDKLAPKNHHSIADWWWRDTWDDYELSTDRFISSPTSLHGVGGARLHFYCLIPATQNLPQGQVRSHIWSPPDQRTNWQFRYQNNPNSYLPGDYYAVYLRAGSYSACYRINNWAETKIGDYDWAPPEEEWYHFRFTWWNGLTPGCEEALCVRLEVEEAGEWNIKGTVYDTLNQWKDSDRNRIGVILHTVSPWIDDTQIYGPA